MPGWNRLTSVAGSDAIQPVVEADHTADVSKGTLAESFIDPDIVWIKKADTCIFPVCRTLYRSIRGMKLLILLSYGLCKPFGLRSRNFVCRTHLI